MTTGCAAATRTMTKTARAAASRRGMMTMKTTGRAAGPRATRTMTARGAATTGCAAAMTTTSRNRDGACARTRIIEILVRRAGREPAGVWAGVAHARFSGFPDAGVGHARIGESQERAWPTPAQCPSHLRPALERPIAQPLAPQRRRQIGAGEAQRLGHQLR